MRTRCRGRALRTITALATATVAAAIALPPTAHADPTPPCASGQVQVDNGGEQAAAGHRRVLLVFRLAPGTEPCTLTGYPGVDTGAGGPLLHAERTLSGFQGGLRTDKLPTVTVAADQPQYAVVEGVAVPALRRLLGSPGPPPWPRISFPGWRRPPGELSPPGASGPRRTPGSPYRGNRPSIPDVPGRCSCHRLIWDRSWPMMWRWNRDLR